MKVVLDCANGATYRVAPTVVRRARRRRDDPPRRRPTGSTSTTTPDRSTPRICAPGWSSPSRHRACFRRRRRSTDRDRREGRGEITGDHIMVICAKRLKDQGKLRNNLVVSTVMSNFGFGLALKALDIDYTAAKVGDRYVLEDAAARRCARRRGVWPCHLPRSAHDRRRASSLPCSCWRRCCDAGQPLSALAKLMRLPPRRSSTWTPRKTPLEELPELKGRDGCRGRARSRADECAGPLLRHAVHVPGDGRRANGGDDPTTGAAPRGHRPKVHRLGRPGISRLQIASSASGPSRARPVSRISGASSPSARV